MSRGETEVTLKFSVIEEIAESVKQHLEREAIRTIRKRDPESGKVCLDKIDGVDAFLYALRDSTNSMIYRQRGLIVDENVSVQVLRSHAKTAIKFPKKKGKPSAVPAPAAREDISDAG